MSPNDQTETGAGKEIRWRRRDWLLLPAVSLLTICLLAVSIELLSRLLFPVTQIGFDNCFAANNPTGDAAVKPNSVCWEQTAESRTKIEYRFNGRGHRAGAELSPKLSGTYRIVLIGSSLTQGLFVPREKTFAALLPQELSLETGRKVEVYNEATGGKFRGGRYPTRTSAQHFDEVLAAQPDLVLWVITPTDVMTFGQEEKPSSPDPQSRTGSAKPATFWSRLTSSIAARTLGERLKAQWERTRTSIVLRHLLIASESENEYVRSYLQNGDDAGFLMAKPNDKWQMQIQAFSAEVSEIVGNAKDAGVPLVAVFIPNRAQAAMIANGGWPAGYDPFKLEEDIRNNVINNGGRFLNVLPGYRTIPTPERGYFPVDGHPDADGQAVIFRLLDRELTNGSVPELRASKPADIAMEPGR